MLKSPQPRDPPVNSQPPFLISESLPRGRRPLDQLLIIKLASVTKVNY